MGNDVKQFRSIEDDCIYFYDSQLQRYRKICDISSFDELPLSIKRQIKAAKEEAEAVSQLPTD